MPVTTDRKVRTAPDTKRDSVTLWIISAACVLIVLLLARQAFDVLALMVICGVVFLLERSVGDWLIDALGPFLSKVVFISGVALIGVILLAMPRVRNAVWAGLGVADQWGFHSVLVDYIAEMPSAGPIPANTGGPAPSGSPGLAQGRSDGTNRPSDSGAPLGRTRMVLRVGGQGTTVLLQADVLTSGGTVTEGNVEFSVNGISVTTSRVIDGRAEARVAVRPGSHRAQARYTGSSKFGKSLTEAAFTR